jgi:hypothetical protein
MIWPVRGRGISASRSALSGENAWSSLRGPSGVALARLLRAESLPRLYPPLAPLFRGRPGDRRRLASSAWRARSTSKRMRALRPFPNRIAPSSVACAYTKLGCTPSRSASSRASTRANVDERSPRSSSTVRRATASERARAGSRLRRSEVVPCGSARLGDGGARLCAKAALSGGRVRGPRIRLGRYDRFGRGSSATAVSACGGIQRCRVSISCWRRIGLLM